MKLWFKLINTQVKNNILLKGKEWKSEGGDDMPEAGLFTILNVVYDNNIKITFEGSSSALDKSPVIIKAFTNAYPSEINFTKKINVSKSPEKLFKEVKKELIAAFSELTKFSQEVYSDNMRH